MLFPKPRCYALFIGASPPRLGTSLSQPPLSLPPRGPEGFLPQETFYFRPFLFNKLFKLTTSTY